jgi:hypothetical protein
MLGMTLGKANIWLWSEASKKTARFLLQMSCKKLPQPVQHDKSKNVIPSTFSLSFRA